MEPKLELLENEKILAQDKIKGQIGTIVAGIFLFIFGIIVFALYFAEILPKFSFDYIYYILASLFFLFAIILIVFGIIKYLQQPRLYVTNMRVFGETYLSQGMSKYFATFSIPLSKISYLSTSSFKTLYISSHFFVGPKYTVLESQPIIIVPLAFLNNDFSRFNDMYEI